jgi:hypothetical protein
MSQQKVIGKTVWNKTAGGRCNYLYSGKFGSGAEAAISVTLVDMENSGEDDLYVKLFYTVDYSVMPSSNYAGFSLKINDEEAFFTKSDMLSDGKGNSPIEPYEFILPRNSKLVVLGISETILADRAVSLIAHPLKVVYA